MDFTKIIKRLDEIKDELGRLRDSHYKTGRDKQYSLKSEARMIIRRVYPNYQEVERKLISCYFGVALDNEKLHQEEFITSLNDLTRTIEIMKSEFELFGFDDFTPVKEKIETEVQIGSGKLGGFWRKKKTN